MGGETSPNSCYVYTNRVLQQRKMEMAMYVMGTWNESREGWDECEHGNRRTALILFRFQESFSEPRRQFCKLKATCFISRGEDNKHYMYKLRAKATLVSLIQTHVGPPRELTLQEETTHIYANYELQVEWASALSVSSIFFQTSKPATIFALHAESRAWERSAKFATWTFIYDSVEMLWRDKESKKHLKSSSLEWDFAWTSVFLVGWVVISRTILLACFTLLISTISGDTLCAISQINFPWKLFYFVARKRNGAEWR